MSKVQSILNQRLKKKPATQSKMASLAKSSADGRISSFSGVFGVVDLSEQEKGALQNLLLRFSEDDQDVSRDLSALISITSEVKAITNQAALLHGERIKRAQEILTEYRDGAFTAWLLTTYGNRQTPYNLLQYYEFCQSMPKPLRPQVERMPRQAVYTLASRDGDLKEKQQIVSKYTGETKEELLAKIREIFPLASNDKRQSNHGEVVISSLTKALHQLERPSARINKRQKETIRELLELIEEQL